MRTLLSVAAIATALILIVSSCTKSDSSSTPPIDPTTVCNPVVYGYYAESTDTLGGPDSVSRFGALDLGSLSLSNVASIKAPARTNQGAYNSSNYTYYVFADSMNVTELVSIDASGNVKYLPINDNSATRYESLVYNSHSDKLYAVKKSISTLVDTLVQINVTSTNFYSTNLATFGQGLTHMTSATVDNSTGTVFLAVNYGSPYYYTLYSYAPGTSALVQLNTSGGNNLLGIRFNKNDKLIYATKMLASGAFNFVRFNTSGTLTKSDTLIADIDMSRFSMCMDVCDNKYIISTAKNVSPGVFSNSQCTIIQVSTTGGTNSSSDANRMLMGLDVKYQ